MEALLQLRHCILVSSELILDVGKGARLIVPPSHISTNEQQRKRVKNITALRLKAIQQAHHTEPLANTTEHTKHFYTYTFIRFLSNSIGSDTSYAVFGVHLISNAHFLLLPVVFLCKHGNFCPIT